MLLQTETEAVLYSIVCNGLWRCQEIHRRVSIYVVVPLHYTFFLCKPPLLQILLPPKEKKG